MCRHVPTRSQHLGSYSWELKLSTCLRPSRHRAYFVFNAPAAELSEVWYRAPDGQPTLGITGGLQGSVTILHSAWSFLAPKCQKTRRSAGLFFIFFSTLFGIDGVEKASKSDQKAFKNRLKWRPGVVLGALGGAPGGIWAPSRPKAKKTRKSEFADPPQGASWEPKFDKNVIWRHFMSFFSSCFSSLDFSSILGDFRLRNWCLFGVADMAQVLYIVVGLRFCSF